MAGAKARKKVPRAVENAVLKEFNHRCAICGEHKPQLHHINEDPSNGRPENLIPLCPNCHLRDQHNPTAPVDTAKLALFRRYKDPTILDPKFHPLWMRCSYLNDVQNIDVELLAALGVELVEFARCLNMGSFYGQRIFNLVCTFQNQSDEPANVVALIQHKKRLSKQLIEQVLISEVTKPFPWNAKSQETYRAAVDERVEQVFALIMELIRYQDWLPPGQYRIGGRAI